MGFSRLHSSLIPPLHVCIRMYSQSQMNRIHYTAESIRTLDNHSQMWSVVWNGMLINGKTAYNHDDHVSTIMRLHCVDMSIITYISCIYLWVRIANTSHTSLRYYRNDDRCIDVQQTCNFLQPER